MTAAGQTPNNAKQNLIAALLSLVVPGSGHLYLGLRRKGIVLLILLAILLIGFWPLRLLRFYPGICFLYFSFFVLYLFAPVSALIARPLPAWKPLSKWWLILFIPASLLCMHLIGVGITRAFGFRSFEVPSTGMDKTIQMGDHIVVDDWYYDSHSPQHQDVIVFKRDNTFFIKRVIAIGGDTVTGKKRVILLNGIELNEPYIEHHESFTQPWMENFGPITVPNGKYFVMGDNRDLSLDSRSPEIGVIDGKSIIGKSLYVFTNRRQGKKIQ
jgi:signal peptidase I